MQTLEELLETAKIIEDARKWLREHPGEVVCTNPDHCAIHGKKNKVDA